jgi:hypothetical protein
VKTVLECISESVVCFNFFVFLLSLLVLELEVECFLRTERNGKRWIDVCFSC